MQTKLSLSPEQLEKLNDGLVVEEKTGDLGSERTVKVYPPCEDNGHDWCNYDLRHTQHDDSWEVSRRCRACGHVDRVEFEDVNEVFRVARGQ